MKRLRLHLFLILTSFVLFFLEIYQYISIGTFVQKYVPCENFMNVESGLCAVQYDYYFAYGFLIICIISSFAFVGLLGRRIYKKIHY